MTHTCVYVWREVQGSHYDGALHLEMVCEGCQ